LLFDGVEHAPIIFVPTVPYQEAGVVCLLGCVLPNHLVVVEEKARLVKVDVAVVQRVNLLLRVHLSQWVLSILKVELIAAKGELAICPVNKHPGVASCSLIQVRILMLSQTLLVLMSQLLELLPFS